MFHSRLHCTNPQIPKHLFSWPCILPSIAPPLGQDGPPREVVDALPPPHATHPPPHAHAAPHATHPRHPTHAERSTPHAQGPHTVTRTQTHARSASTSTRRQHGESRDGRIADGGGGGTGQGQGCCPPAVLLASSTKRAAVRSTDTALQLLSALLTVPDQGPGPGLEGSAISSLAWISSLDPSRWAGRAGHGRRLQPPPPPPRCLSIPSPPPPPHHPPAPCWRGTGTVPRRR
jgi:hypothetical protein